MRTAFRLVATAAVVALCSSSPASAGEWLFKLKDSYAELNAAFVAKDADAMWRLADAPTRSAAGALAYRIREAYRQADAETAKGIRDALGLPDEVVRAMEGRHVLVSAPFRASHPYLAYSGKVQMAGPGRSTPQVPGTVTVSFDWDNKPAPVAFRFTVRDNYAPDYRVSLSVPDLDARLGKPAEVVSTADERKSAALANFRAVQKALRSDDPGSAFPLVCPVSQSQADHFAERMRWHHRRSNADVKARLERDLGLSAAEIGKLRGPDVFRLKLFRDSAAGILAAGDVTFRDASPGDKNRRPSTPAVLLADGTAVPTTATTEDGPSAWKLVVPVPDYGHILFPKPNLSPVPPAPTGGRNPN